MISIASSVRFWFTGAVVIYRLFRALLHVATSVFFRRIEVVGLEHVPPSGPVIFCGNHPNSLLDPALIVTTCGRTVRFAAKDVLFRSRLLRIVLNAFGAVPVQRSKDHKGKVLDNSSAFEQLFAVLASGETMGIFPEGISHDEAQLSRLKTGAARIAQGAAKAHKIKVPIVPCGLHYVNRNRFRSSVLIQYGPPLIVVSEETGERTAAAALTEDIDRGIRALTVNANDWDTLRLMDGVRRLYQPSDITLKERVELARRFNQHYPKVRDLPDVAPLVAHVRAYLGRLYDLGLRDADVVRTPTPFEAAGRVVHHLMLMLFWVPLACIGVPLHVPIGLMLRYSSRSISPRKDVIATTKFLAGFIILALIYLGVGALIGWSTHWGWGLFTTLLLPLSGYATIRVLERSHTIRHAIGILVSLLSLRRELHDLRAERESLRIAVHKTVSRHLPTNVDRLFTGDL